jgi:hypothetical protein
MPGRFPLVAVPLIGDPFCADGFCIDAPGSPAYDYCAFGNILLRVFWTSELYFRRTFNGAIIADIPESLSGTYEVTTGTVWLATRDLNYPAPVPNVQPFPPVGYFSPKIYWDVPTGIGGLYTLSRNAIIITKDCGSNTTIATGIYGSNVAVYADSSFEVGQTLAITKIELRENVTGLGVIGDDITVQGQFFPGLSSGGLPGSQTFLGPANATP